MSPVRVLFRQPDESWVLFAERVTKTEGEAVVVLMATDASLMQGDDRKKLLSLLARERGRMKLAVKDPAILAAARKAGVRTVAKTQELKRLIGRQPGGPEALRMFSPSVWRQYWRSRLQSVGLLSLPKLRIWILIALSSGLFFFVIFRLLPSAEVRVRPRTDSISQTTNYLLVSSGSAALPSTRIATLELLPIEIRLRKTITFDQVGKQFTGKNASVTMTVINKSPGPYSFVKGTRLMNQAGMIFRLKDIANVDAGKEVQVKATADSADLYGEIVGQRGNVPAGLKWEFAGLKPAERALVYAENRVAAAGGVTSHRTVLQQKDMDLGRERLKQELLKDAKNALEEQLMLRSRQRSHASLELIPDEKLSVLTYSGFVLPTQLLGKEATSVSIEGSIAYKVFAYDAGELLERLTQDLETHAGPGKRLVKESLDLSRLKVYVIQWSDDFTWVKITADLVGSEEFVLDPLTPAGARFSRTVRDATAGKTREEALTIVRNLPEVEDAEVSVWPPWSGELPGIASHISVVAQ